MNYRSVSDLNAVVVRSAPRLPRDVQVVVGIPRSGMLAASLVALYLNKPLADLDGFLQGRCLRAGDRLRTELMEGFDPRTVRALVVDDSLQSGRELARTRERLAQAGIREFVRFYCAFVDSPGVSLVDFYGEICRVPRIFEWNFMHHPHLEQTCMDIDGVLCRDPSEEENDDGAHYETFLREAEPLLFPTHLIGWLVTCRLEKYRDQTIQWLSRQGVRYRELIMMNRPDKASRTAGADHGAFKASVYRKTGAILFIESSLQQAGEIARTAGLPVFCLENRSLIAPGTTAVQSNPPDDPPVRLRAARDEICRFISTGDKFILVDEEQLRWSLKEYSALPFLEKDGQYWGPPADDHIAISELNRLREGGARYLIVAWPSFWWLGHYSGFHRYLRENFPCLRDDQQLKVFDLIN